MISIGGFLKNASRFRSNISALRRKGSPAKALGLREAVVNFGTFDFGFTCIVGKRSGVEAYGLWYFGDHLPDDGQDTRGMYWSFGNRTLIWIPRKPTTPEMIGALAHEVTHVIRAMFVTWAGLPLTRDTDEAYAHAMGYAMRELLTALR